MCYDRMACISWDALSKLIHRVNIWRTKSLKRKIKKKSPNNIYARSHIIIMYYSYMVNMFSVIEQEDIISEFLNKINMNDTIRMINRKIGMRKECKFNYNNIQLYKTKLSENIIKHICKYNYTECYKCKRLKQFGTFVNIDTCNKSKEFIKLTKIIEMKRKKIQPLQQTTSKIITLQNYISFRHSNLSNPIC